MRIVSDFYREDLKISIFDFDLKYVIKFEFRGLEQTFKLDKLEFKDITELENKLDKKFLKVIRNRFESMSDDLKLLYWNKHFNFFFVSHSVRNLILILFLLSCSEIDDYSSPIKKFKHNEFFISFDPTNNGGIITDRNSCLGWTEIMGCPIESKKYLKGTTIEVWAMPFDGYKFVGWSGSYDSTKNPLLITVDSEKEVIAIFSK